MSPTEAIGVDLGGTKMLVGVLDAGSEVRHESRESSINQNEDQLIELLVSEIEEARQARPGVAAVGLGIPATIDHDRGFAISAVNLPIDDLPIRDLVGERTGLPIFVDNDANVAALAEHLYGAARGADNAVMLTIGTGIGGGLILGGEVYRGATGAGAELGHMVIAMDGLPCQGNCPGHGCVETYASGTAIGREGREAAEREPDSALGKLFDGARRVRPRRRAARRRPDQLRQHLRARGDRGRRRRDRRRRRSAARPRPSRAARAGAAADERDAGPRRRDGRGRRDDRRRGDGAHRARAGTGGLMPGELIVCPTPIGNLDDLTARAREALVSADYIACEDTRRTGGLLDKLGIRPAPPLISNHEGNEAARATELAQKIERGATVVLVSDAGMPAISDPGYRLIRRCIERALEVTVLPGPSVVPVALVASGLPTDRWRFEGFLPKRSEAMEQVLRSDLTVVAFESPRRIGDSLAALAAIAPDRPVAVCRELTKMHEEISRGSLAELARRFRGDVKGEIVLVIGPASSAEHDQDVGFAVDALRHLVQSGARPRAAASVVAALTGTRANDLYRALTGREPRQ
jgi:16S rRNA (cytidine1402-2'-O)-methyltransferase